MVRYIAIILFILFSPSTQLLAQVLYSKSLSATEIVGVWSKDGTTVKMPNVITDNPNALYVSDNNGKYPNIQYIKTEKLDFNNCTWIILEITYLYYSDYLEGQSMMTQYLVLSEDQFLSIKDPQDKVCLTQIPQYETSYNYVEFRQDAVIDNIKKSILEKNDILAKTYAISVERNGNVVKFCCDTDLWTHSGDVSNRTYHPLDFFDNSMSGYYEIEEKSWGMLFYR